jgi:hypothetical protein
MPAKSAYYDGQTKKCRKRKGRISRSGKQYGIIDAKHLWEYYPRYSIAGTDDRVVNASATLTGSNIH